MLLIHRPHKVQIFLLTIPVIRLGQHISAPIFLRKNSCGYFIMFSIAHF